MNTIISDKVNDYTTIKFFYNLIEENETINLTILDPLNTTKYNISLKDMETMLYLAVFNEFLISVNVDSHREYFN